MEEQVYFLNHNLTLTIVFLVSALFAAVGIIYSKKHQGLENYLTANKMLTKKTIANVKLLFKKYTCSSI